MQKSTTRKTDRNTNTDNYDKRNMWKRMISEHEMLTASFMTKSSQELTMTQWKNKMRIINAIMKSEWFMTSETW